MDKNEIIKSIEQLTQSSLSGVKGGKNVNKHDSPEQNKDTCKCIAIAFT